MGAAAGAGGEFRPLFSGWRMAAFDEAVQGRLVDQPTARAGERDALAAGTRRLSFVGRVVRSDPADR